MGSLRRSPTHSPEESLPQVSRRNALLVYPKFEGTSFWNYQATCELMGARYSAAPLGLITVAALLPGTWDVRLVNRNTDELREEDLAWADVVMTGGMLPQQPDTLRIVEMAHALGQPVVVGGPDATCSPETDAAADFLVLGEAEEIMADFVAAFAGGATKGIFTGEPLPGRHPLPGSPLRPAPARPLPPRRGAVLARLPLRLRVLQRHRPERPRACSIARPTRSRPPLRHVLRDLRGFGRMAWMIERSPRPGKAPAALAS